MSINLIQKIYADMLYKVDLYGLYTFRRSDIAIDYGVSEHWFKEAIKKINERSPYKIEIYKDIKGSFIATRK